MVRRHISMQEQESFEEHYKRRIRDLPLRPSILVAVSGVLLGILVLWFNVFKYGIVPIEHAKEHYLDLGHGIYIWYRTWGNAKSGIPTLFVHGGPGNCIADYGMGNARFFERHKHFVIEVDQRGTGHSKPSLRDDCKNLEYYKDITIQQMSEDFEVLREALGIEKWLVFGGSWGSTLGIDYAERFPHRCLGLIVRGIWLNTAPEFDAIFIRKAYEGNRKELDMFDTWFELAARDAKEAGEPELDPNDGERFFRINGRMIQRCDTHAIWRAFAWETNLMEEDPANHLDPYEIKKDRLPEATSVAFFENRMFLYGTYDEPMDLIGNVERLKPVNIWICQGLRDKVCPAKDGARLFVDALIRADVTTRSQFVDGGHEDSDPAIEKCLKDSVSDFLSTMKD